MSLRLLSCVLNARTPYDELKVPEVMLRATGVSSLKDLSDALYKCDKVIHVLDYPGTKIGAVLSKE